jgi:hypothetical protein
MASFRNSSGCNQKGSTMYRSTKKKFVKRMSISAAVALGALATGAGVASASTTTTKGTHITVSSSKAGTRTASSTEGQACGPGPGGVVTGLSATSITVTDPAGTSETFAITSATTVTKERASSSFSDLAVGDEVRIMPSAEGSTTAAAIDIELPSLMGKVTAVSGNTITITGPSGTAESVIVSSTTSYNKDGSSATLADVTVGTSIFAEGTFATGSTTTLGATTVGIGTPPHQGGQGDGHPGGPVPMSGSFGPGAPAMSAS